MIKKIVLGLAVVIALLAIVISMQPDEFHVSRSATISAPADVVFAQVNNLKAWQAWSPWIDLDPKAKNSFEGPEAGVGAIMRWAGDMNVGEGSMTITQSKPGELVEFRLDFIKPMEGTSTAEFTFKPEGDKTLVTWSMYGKNGFMAKAMSLVMDCDKMVGEQFDKGLAKLKAVTEKPTS